MRATTAFKKICKLKHRNKVIQGSQGGGKTYSILLRWILLAVKSEKKQFCSIVTATFPALESGAIKDFQAICESIGVTYTGTKKPYVFRIGLWTFQFFSIDRENKGLGARRDRLFINEANRIPFKIARQLISRTHVECIFDFNPVNSFWAHYEFVDVNDCDFIKLTYKDNECLPESEIKEIEKYSPWGLRPDPNHWRVYGLGEIGMAEGVIYGGFETYKDLPEGQYQMSAGLDFGWVDPLAIVKAWINHEKKEIYFKQLFYGSNAQISDIIPPLMEELKGLMLYCDHKPEDIYRLRMMGLSAVNAFKNPIEDRIRSINRYKLFVHEDSAALISELSNYSYQTIDTPKGMEIIPYPKPNQRDHAINASEYAVTNHIARKI